ncbi:hypothetical protein KC19_12G066000 [Ceratodon purpureus]|uniref:Uncharacterized protein n=1 Tax=Ceratodon purpureus TaxID=3225 RepID=A0A8T0G7Z6_CERPU|nr:hypothetical protein KC19_12G066000 [Ceratodon purpureus]
MLSARWQSAFWGFQEVSISLDGEKTRNSNQRESRPDAHLGAPTLTDRKREGLFSATGKCLAPEAAQ